MVPETWSATDRLFCHFGFCIFCPFNLPNNLENQDFEKKMKKKPADSIILQMCTLMTIISCIVSEIWSVTEFFVMLDHFFALLFP